jgi:hypothetical protein
LMASFVPPGLLLLLASPLSLPWSLATPMTIGVVVASLIRGWKGRDVPLRGRSLR